MRFEVNCVQLKGIKLEFDSPKIDGSYTKAWKVKLDQINLTKVE